MVGRRVGEGEGENSHKNYMWIANMRRHFSIECIAEVCHVISLFFFFFFKETKISKPCKLLLVFFMQLEFMAVVYLK